MPSKLLCSQCSNNVKPVSNVGYLLITVIKIFSYTAGVPQVPPVKTL